MGGIKRSSVYFADLGTSAFVSRAGPAGVHSSRKTIENGGDCGKLRIYALSNVQGLAWPGDHQWAGFD